MNRALICGVNGQDGAYLSQLLLQKNYEVIGTSRDASLSEFANLQRLGIKDRVLTISMDLGDYQSVFAVINRYRATEIYNLAGQSSVGMSFEQPVETIRSIAFGTLNILEAVRQLAYPVRFYSAGSGECFGNTPDFKASEETPFRPRSPYGVAKATAYNLVENYREAYGLFACTGILFNHESPLRPGRFVTQKIVQGARSISQGKQEKLELGSLDVHRDWGWAPEFVQAMWLMLQKGAPADYVIATGRTVSLGYFIEKAFAHFALDWRDFVKERVELCRPSEIAINQASPEKARHLLPWRSLLDVDDVVQRMCEDRLE